MTRLFLPAFLLTLLLGGCESTPVPMSAAKQAPANRVLAFQTPTGEKTAILTVIRDDGFPVSGCNIALYINQVLAARFEAAEYAQFYVESGEILLRVGWDPQGKGLCSFGQDQWTQRETFLKPDERKSFRLSFGTSGRFDIQRTDF